MLITGPQHSSPRPLRPLSVKLPSVKPARCSRPTTLAIDRIISRSNVAAQEGPLGNDVEHRPVVVQLENMLEWMQFAPQ
jgi:hypothetical protein